MKLKIIFLTFVRIILQINFRMLYPFFAVFARGIGVTTTELSLAVTARSLTGAAVPLLTPISDNYGRKKGMMVALVLYILGNVIIVLKPTFPALIPALCFCMLGTYLFIPTLQAYVGDHTSFNERGRMIGITELSWSLSFIIGMPLVSLLISAKGWLSPFKTLLVLGSLCFIAVYLIIPAESPPQKEQGSSKGINQLLASKQAMLALGLAFTFAMANEIVSLMFGVWLEGKFGLQIAALGAASMLIGIAELSGETLTTLIVDRLGKQRSVLIGLVLNIIVCLALPLVSRSLVGALMSLFFFFLLFECTIVSFLPLASEILPKVRATLLGSSYASMLVGRALGAFISPRIYTLGFGANTYLAALLFVVSIIFLLSIKLDIPEKEM